MTPTLRLLEGPRVFFFSRNERAAYDERKSMIPSFNALEQLVTSEVSTNTKSRASLTPAQLELLDFHALLGGEHPL